MRIGQFGKKFKVPVSTIRHYVSLGLLLPQKTSTQYIFNDNCVQDMEMIEELKDLGFNLAEISQIVAARRSHRFGNHEENKILIYLFEKRKKEIEKEQKRLLQGVKKIEDYLRVLVGI